MRFLKIPHFCSTCMHVSLSLSLHIPIYVNTPYFAINKDEMAYR